MDLKTYSSLFVNTFTKVCQGVCGCMVGSKICIWFCYGYIIIKVCLKRSFCQCLNLENFCTWKCYVVQEGLKMILAVLDLWQLVKEKRWKSSNVSQHALRIDRKLTLNYRISNTVVWKNLLPLMTKQVASLSPSTVSDISHSLCA